MSLRELPVLEQIVAMKVMPLHDRLQRAPGKPAGHDPRLDLDGDSVLAIAGVE
jgi:hypothetical protein